MPVSSKTLEHLKAANLLFDHKLYRDSVSRAYYAVFTAAWDYVGDSATGEWNNRSIRKAFSTRMHADGVEHAQSKQMNIHFEYMFEGRQNADYSHLVFLPDEAKDFLTIAREFIEFVERRISHDVKN